MPPSLPASRSEGPAAPPASRSEGPAAPLRSRLLPRDPILQLTLVALLTRVLGIIRHYFSTDLLGNPVAPAPSRLLTWALTAHIGTLLLIGTALALLARIPHLRRPLLLFATLSFLIITFFGQVDLELLRALGIHLSPSFLAQYARPTVFADAGQGFADDAPHLLLSGALILIAWVSLLIVAIRAWRRPAPALRWSPLPLSALIGALCLTFAFTYNYRRSRVSVISPPEILFLRDALGANRTPPPTAAALAQLRASLALPNPASAPDFPLTHTPPPAATPSPATPPDIFFIVIESLRGRELHNHPERAPNLTALSKRGVHFPYLISNGFPSDAGFLALQCSAWPHPTRFSLTDFSGHNYDCLGERLRSLGYFNAFFAASNPSMDNQLAWIRRMADLVSFVPARTYDRELVARVSAWLDEEDNRETSRPLFGWFATISTHQPFLVLDPEHRPIATDDVLTRYLDALAYTDAQIGALVTRLEASAKARNREQVLVIVGDHAFPVDETTTSPALEAQGCDRRVWTAATIIAPPALIGPPRVLTFPASQVDIMPTILNILGDVRQTAALGQDLLHDGPRPREAIAVTQGGLRLDRGDTSFFAALDGESAWQEPRLEGSGCGAPPGAPPDPDAIAVMRDIIERVRTWSWLVENDRILPHP